MKEKSNWELTNHEGQRFSPDDATSKGTKSLSPGPCNGVEETDVHATTTQRMSNTKTRRRFEHRRHLHRALTGV